MVLKEVTNQIPKFASISIAQIAKSQTLSAVENLYGVRVKNGKRTSLNNTSADRVTCPKCGRKAYKHVKIWEEKEKQRPLYVCNGCNSIFEEETK